ncbi:hypothetical protein EKO23_16405 [Nocardioides guangzhouensis]|uniref:N-acetyltransferase n=1 Tax=Nocardioides guangzhouensis TaxID=2497878 RepID=A0A4Q4ZAH4_9ACTN|nr:hypothetical protein [Nocardioides guangzhouensis]RYP84241.1 hypothetical protein EKO23_16405 [Nocardioides guangzhouensis]
MMNTPEVALVATVDDRMMANNWPVVAREHPRVGPPGIRHEVLWHRTGKSADCLSWRDNAGQVRGLLYHYRCDFPPYERRGNVNLLIDPAWHRRGLGSYLLAEADRRWELDFSQQSYTTAGLALVRTHLGTTTRRPF